MRMEADVTLRLYYHPFSSFCQKALIALYELDIAFEPVVVDLGNPVSRADFQALWPLAKFPVLRDEEWGLTLPESSIVIEYLARLRPERQTLLPEDPDTALQARLWDRFFDGYVNQPMQKIVADRLRPPDRLDPHGVKEARALLDTAYGIAEPQVAARRWATGDYFTLADCAAAPALFYADWVHPFRERFPALASYFDRLMARPSFARAVDEAKPYRHLFPKEPATA
jgi:glutathione S-transferase